MLEIKTAKNPLVTDSKKRQILLPLELFADAYRKSDSAAGAKNRSIIGEFLKKR